MTDDETPLEDDQPIDNGADELVGPTEEERAAMAAAHSDVMNAMAPAAPPAAPSPALDHAKVLDEMSGSLEAPRPSMLEEAEEVAAAAPTGDTTEEPPKLYRVPPKERTPQNRAARRAEHDRVMGGMDAPPRTENSDLPEAEEGNPEFPGGFDFDSLDYGDGNEAQQPFSAAHLDLESKQVEFLKDHARQLQDLVRFLEAERL